MRADVPQAPLVDPDDTADSGPGAASAWPGCPCLSLKLPLLTSHSVFTSNEQFQLVCYLKCVDHRGGDQKKENRDTLLLLSRVLVFKTRC